MLQVCSDPVDCMQLYYYNFIKNLLECVRLMLNVDQTECEGSIITKIFNWKS